MELRKRVGWWMDQDTCIGCDRPREKLGYVNYIDVRPKAELRRQPHAHDVVVMLCEVCSNLFCAPDSYIQDRMDLRLQASRENCKCHTFFETQSNTSIAMMHSRS